nr:pre-mRNA splicing Prp18-interacting factor [Tanacetum cinerariifolium]
MPKTISVTFSSVYSYFLNPHYRLILMSTFVLCVRCGEPLYGFSPCRWCTCERCGNDLLNGFCALGNSRNSCIYDPNPNSFDYPPDSYHPPHPTYETYSGDSCGNDSHFGYDCLPRLSHNYEPEPGYIQNYTSYPHDSSSFPQQYLCCDNYGGLHETFQCQPMNQNFYNSNSSGFDQSQPPQFPVIHSPPQETCIKILHDQENAINFVQTFLRKFNRYSFFETPNVLLLAWDRVFKIKDAFGNKQYKPKDIQELFRELFNDVQNIHEELAEYINTPGWNRLASTTMAMMIARTESDEFIKSNVEDLVPNPSEFKDECKCDVPDCDDSQTTNFSTFSNPLFDDSTSSDNESSHEEVIHEMSFKTYSNPLFDLDEEIISSEFNPIHNEDLDSTPKNDRFDTESYLLKSLLNHDALMASSLKIDSLLVEFAGELVFLKSIPPRIDEANCDPEEDIHLVERFLYDNSSLRPPEEFVYENSNANIESFSPSPIPIEDSDSFMKEINLSFNSDDPMSPSIKDDDDDSVRDILILE